MLRSIACVLVLAAGMAQPSGTSAANWEAEASAGVGSGTKFSVPAPFTLAGVTYAGPYNVCELPEGTCLFFGRGDIAYSRFDEYPGTFFAAADVRRRVGGAWSAGAGALMGGARRSQHVSRQVLSEVDHNRPPEPEELSTAAQRNVDEGGRPGAGWLAYLHGGLRYDRVFGPPRSLYGQARARNGVFVEGGAGVLPAFLGSGEVPPHGMAPAIHVAVGFRRHRLRHDFTVTATHVRALVDSGDLTGAHFAWTMLRLGWVFD
jgi:hypothetical protein